MPNRGRPKGRGYNWQPKLRRIADALTRDPTNTANNIVMQMAVEENPPNVETFRTTHLRAWAAHRDIELPAALARRQAEREARPVIYLPPRWVPSFELSNIIGFNEKMRQITEPLRAIQDRYPAMLVQIRPGTERQLRIAEAIRPAMEHQALMMEAMRPGLQRYQQMMEEIRPAMELHRQVMEAARPRLEASYRFSDF